MNKKKVLSMLQYGCVDMLIFMFCYGIMHNLYSEDKWIAHFGTLMAAFGCTPVTRIIWNKYKEIRKEEI